MGLIIGKNRFMGNKLAYWRRIIRILKKWRVGYKFLAIICLISIILAGMSISLGRNSGTCTQGNAGHLASIFYTVVFISVSVMLVYVFRIKIFASISVLIGLTYISSYVPFSFHMSYHLIIEGGTACGFLEGPPYFKGGDPMFRADGDELLYAVMWPVTTGLALVAAFALLLRVTKMISVIRRRRQKRLFLVLLSQAASK